MAIQAQRFPSDISGFSTVGGGTMQQQQHIFQFQNQSQQQQQPQLHVSDTPSFNAYSPSIGFDACYVVEKQSVEVDRYILSQSERLRLFLGEQRKREVMEFITKIDARTSFLVKQKDEQIARAAFRTSNLESLFLKLQNEAQTWQHIARRNELHVVNLRNSIQLLHHSSALHGGELVDDSESCCDESGDRDEMVVCIICQTRERSVVLLPCRHLCCCTVCVNMIVLCPVCQTEKKATIDALFH